jgi:hypothetical protein
MRRWEKNMAWNSIRPQCFQNTCPSFSTNGFFELGKCLNTFVP